MSIFSRILGKSESGVACGGHKERRRSGNIYRRYEMEMPGEGTLRGENISRIICNPDSRRCSERDHLLAHVGGHSFGSVDARLSNVPQAVA